MSDITAEELTRHSTWLLLSCKVTL